MMKNTWIDRGHPGKLIITVISLFLLLLLLLSGLWTPARADVGPKPSVYISVTAENGTDLSSCYGTLLGSVDGYGPYSAVPKPEEGEEFSASGKGGENEAFEAFRFYEDPDGYYFWGQVFTLEGGAMSWGYYPPEQFKILIYDTETGKYYISEKQERFAFDSYYEAVITSKGTIAVGEVPETGKQTGGFFLRVILTILIELLAGLLFGYRKKREILVIVCTNIVTQGLLNLALAILSYEGGLLTWIIILPILEVIVFALEAVIYAFLLKSEEKGRGRAVLYALAANILSFGLGFFLGLLMEAM